MDNIWELVKKFNLDRDITLPTGIRISLPAQGDMTHGEYRQKMYTALSMFGDAYKNNLDQITRETLTCIRIIYNILSRGKRLDLAGLMLKEVPEQVYNLQHLQVLDLSNNEIVEIPSEINKIVSLKTLILRRNKINNISVPLIELTNLKKIILHGNKIQEILPDILPTGLHWLGLSTNQLNHFPDAVFNLPYLRGVWLCENQIDDLPKEFYDYIQKNPTFRSIYLHGNPLKKIPIYHWKGNRFDSVKNYLSASYKGTITNYEAKIILVGNGDSGKTTLRKRLSSIDFQPHGTERTDKIEIDEIDFGESTNSINIFDLSNNANTNFQPLYKAKIWDFGGQEIQRDIHTFFLTDNALYLLLWSVRHSGDKYDNIKRWLNIIKSYSPKSKIVIILNKAYDQGGKLVKQESAFLNEEAIKKAFPENVIDFIEVSALYGKGVEGENGLREKIKKDYLPLLDKVGEELPISWYKIKEKLETMSSTVPFIDKENFWEDCLDDATLGLQPDSFDDILDWLVNIGVVLYYPVKGLDKYIFIRPEWIIDPIYEVLLDEKGIIKRNNGKFAYSNFGTLCTLSKSSQREIIIDLLTHFYLCVPVDNNKKEFFIPQLLDEIKESELEVIEPFNNHDIHYEYRFLYQSSSILYQIIGECYRRKIVCKEQIWKNAVLVGDNDNQAIIFSQVLARDKIIVRVKGTTPLDFIEKIINNIFTANDEFFYSKLEGKYIACNCIICRRHLNGPSFYEEKTLEDMKKKKKMEVQCIRSYDMQDISKFVKTFNKAPKDSQDNERNLEPGNISVTVNVTKDSEVTNQVVGSGLTAKDINAGDKGV